MREAIQNSIDSCRYKKSFNSDYEPIITITLCENKLIINDNGLGMDEFIVRNYFSKLASSYYTSETLKNDFDSIGQFGIGVFSYFLLCDSFEIETKMKDKDALKFIVNRDPERYFYFYNDSNNVIEGTKITLHLKNILQLEELVQYIDTTFYLLSFQ